MNTKTARDESRAALLGAFELKPGDEIQCVLRHVSRSGMSRWVDFYVIREGSALRISWHVANVTGFKYDRRREAVKVEGCGMDMGFHAVYNLGAALWPDGFGCIGDGFGFTVHGAICPSNDHSNGDRNYTPHGHRGPQYDGTKESLRHWHQEGGYALRHRWI